MIKHGSRIRTVKLDSRTQMYEVGELGAVWNTPTVVSVQVWACVSLT